MNNQSLPTKFVRTLKYASLLLVTGVSCSLLAHPVSAFSLGQNLIVNGDAEQGSGDPVGDAVGANIPFIPGWTTTADFSVLQYGASGFEFVNPLGQLVQVSGLPANSNPGPADRGSNLFFGGGARASSSATQTIDLSGASSTIDSGLLAYELSGWLGGYTTDLDSAALIVSFLGAAGQSLGSASITAPTPTERSNITGLFFRATDGIVPVGTRQANILLDMNYNRGRVNDGYADNLSLSVQAVPEPTTIVAAVLAGALGAGVKRWRKGIGRA